MQTEPNDPAYLTLPGELTPEQEIMEREFENLCIRDYVEENFSESNILEFFWWFIEDNDLVKRFELDATEYFKLREHFYGSK